MISINLLPPELKLKRVQARRNASLTSICIVVVFVIIVIGIIIQSFQSTFAASLSNTANDITKESQNIDQFQDLQDMALFINDRWQTYQTIAKDRVLWNQTLQELNNCTPVTVQFETLTINSEKAPNFVVQGNTNDEREIIKFKEKLEDSQYFKDVTFKSSALTTDQAQTTPNENQKLKFTLEFSLEKKGTASASGEKEIK